MKQFKVDSHILLEYACKLLNTKPQYLEKRLRQQLQLDGAQLINKTTTVTQLPHPNLPETKLVKHEYLWSTPTALVKTTVHNRIKDFELRGKK